MSIVQLSNPRTTLAAEVVTGTAVQALVELSLASAGEVALPGPVRAGLDQVGDRVGETWLHLLGACLELAAPFRLADLIRELERMDPLDLRRLLLGAGAWSWRALAGSEVIDAAARGDRAAQRTLLSHDRYYGGRAREALGTVMGLDPHSTRERLLETLRAYQDHRTDEEVAGRLETVAAATETLVSEGGLLKAVEALTGGYRYVPEPEASRVVLMPHAAAAPLLCLAQHEDARLIVFGSPGRLSTDERVIRLGGALSDESRLAILHLLSEGARGLGDLVEETGLARSTVHHHLSVLRRAGLVRFEGNARAYRYSIHPRALVEATESLAALLAVKREGSAI